MYITWSNGDTLSCIPLIEKILSKYPNVQITFCCYESHKYLLEHLPISFVTLNFHERLYRFRQDILSNIIESFRPKDHYKINCHGGQYSLQHSWRNQIKTFNNQCKENNLSLFIEEEDFGYINLPTINVDVMDNSVYVENSATQSNQTDFEFNIEKLSLMFPRINFYLTGNSNFKSRNIFPCGDKNLIYLSNVSKKCKLILGKGSGPFFCTLNEDNKNKLKALVGLKYIWTKDNFKFWEPKDEKIILINTETEIFNLLRNLNK